MKEFKYTITDSQGIAAKQGEEVVIRVEGADEAEAAAAMETFFKENL